MANRILRDWTTSEAIDSISLEAEVFFTRLIMKADDYGSYYANPKLLKAALYPLKEVTYEQIGKWVFECTEAGLIFPYEVDGKEYIRINNFKQRLRQMRNVFPHPTNKRTDHLPATRQPLVSELSASRPPEREVETKQETESERESARVSVEVVKVSRETKIKLSQEIFGDELFIEQLSLTHKGKDIKQAFEECYTHHANAPNAPQELWEWKKKLNTWLSNTKTPKKYASNSRTLTETSPAPGTDYTEKF